MFTNNTSESQSADSRERQFQGNYRHNPCQSDSANPIPENIAK
jgi:hypothetical protein